jgi:hypothetical protein
MQMQGVQVQVMQNFHQKYLVLLEVVTLGTGQFLHPNDSVLV